MTRPLKLYTCFHLNLAFSSVEGRLRSRIVERCYWPLLDIARDLNIPLGIEASGSTLEMIDEIDPTWTVRLRELCKSGCVDFIGSGYVQMIGPLVPAEINRANLRLGHTFYEKYIGFRPALALINEQAYSPGVVPLYREAGYDAFIMDWANPFSRHENWDPSWQYRVQQVLGSDGLPMKVVWNHSIPFQKFQRFVYQEMSMDRYLDYLASHIGKGDRAFPMYGSDAEVFDFRPGRYSTEEAALEGEWGRIRTLFEHLIEDPRFEFVKPSDLLDDVEDTAEPLVLETPDCPIPVKKQPKYNITRWAVSGRDDTWINTACWRLFEKMQHSAKAFDEGKWRHLCLMWRSDYRTHITDTRWNIFCWDVLEELYSNKLFHAPEEEGEPYQAFVHDEHGKMVLPGFVLTCKDNTLRVEMPNHAIDLNLRRGMSITTFTVPEISPLSLFGTLEHGFFHDINWSADFYSGHLVAEIAGAAKVCDLDPMDPHYLIDAQTGALHLHARISTQLGTIDKTLILYSDEPRIDISYALSWPDVPPGNLRLGHVTLNPEAFALKDLHYQTHNGGDEWERHSLRDGNVDLGRAVSFLTSAQCGLGMTKGVLQIGDDSKSIEIETDKARAATIGLVTCQTVGDSYFCRMGLSAREMDDTSRLGSILNMPERDHYSLTIRVKKKDQPS